MPEVAFSESYVTLWRGKDCLAFIDGLSSNLVLGLSPNKVIQSAILDKNAKIIDFVTIINLGEFLAVVGYMPNFEALLNFVTPKILQSDVVISDISNLNDVIIHYDDNSGGEIGSCETSDGETKARVSEKITFCIVSKNMKIDCKEMDQDFHEWRIKNLIPWYGYEILFGKIPYVCGLENYVHVSKGCYTGQEILTRMRTRSRGMKKLISISNSDFANHKITTKGKTNSLTIISQ